MNRQMRAYYKSSYAFRDKLDTDGFEGAGRYFDLAEALIRRGYTDPQIIVAILGGNFRRLLSTAIG